MKDDTDNRGTGRSYGRYRTLYLIGEGAMGSVYLAEDPVIGRRVAVKVLQPQPGLSPAEQEEVRSRFEAEFRAAGNLAHPNIVTIHDVGREGDESFIAMEYLEGDTLRTVLSRGKPLAFARVLVLLEQIASALDFAHARGVIHRDVKPANILLTSRGDAKIADFGVAKLASSELTRTGIILGTPAYMSPEQVTDQKLSPTADQFSLAVMAYQMLTGRRPFGGENPTKTLYQIAYHEPAPATQINHDLPVPVDTVLRRAMAKKSDERFPSCRALVQALSEALTESAEVRPGEDGGPSELATQRMAETAAPTLDMPGLEPVGGSQPSLMDALLQLEEDDEVYSGPPPPEPPRPEAETPPPRPMPPPPEPKVEEIALVPLADEAAAPEQEVFGEAAKDSRYRFWQAVGMTIALVVGVGLWSCWGPVREAAAASEGVEIDLLDSRRHGQPNLPAPRRDDQPRLREEPGRQRDHVGAAQPSGT